MIRVIQNERARTAANVCMNPREAQSYRAGYDDYQNLICGEADVILTHVVVKT